MKDKHKNYKFKVSLDGFGETPPRERPPSLEAGFASVGPPKDITFERKLEPGDLDPFREWMEESRCQEWANNAKGRGGFDARFKNMDGFDIEHWVWKKWVPRWVMRLLGLLPDWKAFNRFRHKFMRLKTVYKNCYVKDVRYVDEDGGGEDVKVTEMTLEGD